jgi:hypothetical protein
MGGAILAAVVLQVCGMQLVTLEESHTYSFAEGSITAAQFRIHWLLGTLCVAALVGAICAVWPHRKPPLLLK